MVLGDNAVQGLRDAVGAALLRVLWIVSGDVEVSRQGL